MKNLFDTCEEMFDYCGYEWSEDEAIETLKYYETEEDLADYLDRLDDIRESASELMYIDNAIIYLESCSNDCPIFEMDELNEILSNCSPLDIAKKIAWGDFNPGDDYFTIKDDGNLYSSNYREELNSDISDIIDSAINIYNAADKLFKKELDNFNSTYGLNLKKPYEVRNMLENFESVERVENLKNECGELMFR